MTTTQITRQLTDQQATVEDPFWVRVFQALHPGLCAISLISGAPIHRSFAAMLEGRHGSDPERVR